MKNKTGKMFTVIVLDIIERRVWKKTFFKKKNFFAKPLSKNELSSEPNKMIKHSKSRSFVHIFAERLFFAKKPMSGKSKKKKFFFYFIFIERQNFETACRIIDSPDLSASFGYFLGRCFFDVF
jgi:hypothetical protein